MTKYQKVIDNRLKAPKTFFDWCYRQIPTIRWKNKNQVIETQRDHDVFVITKRLTKSSKLDFFDKFYSFGIILVTAKRIEVQTYSFWSRYDQGREVIKYELSNFEQMSNNQHIALGRMNGKYSLGLTPNYDYGGPYTGTKFFDNGWEAKIASISELKYLQFPMGLSYYNLPHMYKYRAEIEFLQKINAAQMADDLAYDVTDYDGWHVRKAVDCRVITKNWLHQNKQFFKNSNRRFRDFELERRIKARGGQMVPGIERYLTYVDINKIPKAAKMNRFQNWVIKNKLNFGYYCDYLGMLSDLDIVPDTENLIMPKDLVKAHDNAVKLLNQHKREIKQKEFTRRTKVLAKYECTIGDYYFRAPIDARELIREGKALSHCVGSSRYIEDHAKGRTTIVFVRLVTEINKPLYTLELKSGSIFQIRGKHNQSAPDIVWETAEEWLKQVNRSRVGKNKKAAA